MTDESKPKSEKQVENLELNKETIQDLIEGEAEQVQGGLYPLNPPSSACVTCSKRCGTG